MNDYVRLTIEDLKRQRQTLDDLIKLLTGLFGVAESDSVPSVTLLAEIIRPDAVPDKSSETKKRHGRRAKLTRYKGVKVSKPAADGRPKFEAYIPQNGRSTYLGFFETEEEAAAALAEAQGNEAEAKRLRKLAAKIAKPERPVKERRRHSRRGPKSSKSEFRGVTARKAYGKMRYQATAWDAANRKTVCLGTFGDELEAAMAVAKRLNDQTEIQRIADLIEQREDNPDRLPKSRQREPAGQGGQIGQVGQVSYECDHCHLSYQPPRPQQCIRCSGASFTEKKT